jgi:glyoxylate reductase
MENMMTTSPSTTPRAFAARLFTPQVMQALGERFSLRINAGDRVLTANEIAASAKECEYLFVSVTENVDAKVIESLASTLKVIATLSVGTDHIDLQAARANGVAVVTTPDVLSAACAELAWMLILGATRRGHEADALVRSGRWPGWAPTQLLGRGLVGRRLGILGMGRIGREVAARAAGFGVTLHYHNRQRLEPALEQGATYQADADSLVASSDILCLCAPGGRELEGFLDARRIDLLPPDPIVVNIARGDLVNDDALIAALESGRVFAAGLDVYRGEPAIDPRYASLPNTFLSPHLGSSTLDTRDAMGFLLLKGIDAFEAGLSAPNLTLGDRS